jgi:hypothetical protein
MANTIRKDHERVLHKLYYTPGSPAAFGSLNRLYQHVRKQRHDVTRLDVRKWMLSQDTYTLHAPARKRLSIEPRTYVPDIDDQWCADLADMADLADENEGNKFILTVIDAFSKYAWAQPMKNKSGPTTAEAFKAILSRTDRRPKLLQTDHGNEFYNASFNKVLKDESIELFSSYSNHKASMVERFNRSIKSLMYKYFTANSTNRWLQALQPLVDTYNTRRHRSIGMPPASVNASNAHKVYAKLYSERGCMKPGVMYEGGDLVRINKAKGNFEKGYLPNYTQEIFRIRTVRPAGYNTPLRYILEDLAGDQVQGTFVSQELQKVIKDLDKTKWRIEKVLSSERVGKGKRARTRYLVKWLGYPDKFNSYVGEADIADHG